jgi:hypothetical protein
MFCIFSPLASSEHIFRAAYINAHMSWRWVFGIWGIVGASLIIPYVVLVPETRGGVILAARAQRARKDGQEGAWAIHEKVGRRSARQIFQETVFRPASKLASRTILQSNLADRVTVSNALHGAHCILFCVVRWPQLWYHRESLAPDKYMATDQMGVVPCGRSSPINIRTVWVNRPKHLLDVLLASGWHFSGHSSILLPA